MTCAWHSWMRKRSMVRLELELAVIAFAMVAGSCRIVEPSDAPVEEAAPAARAPVDGVSAAQDDGPIRIDYPASVSSLARVVRELAPSVVSLHAAREVSGGPASVVPGASASTALGSGFIIDRDGYLVTNDHVLGTAAELTAVFSDGSAIAAQVVGRHPALDIALLKIEPPTPPKPVRLGNSSRLAVGEWVLALGNPFGDEVTASAGIVSSVRGAAPVVEDGADLRLFLQTDAAIHPANSGGPLVNTAGEVIGVTTAMDVRGQNIGFAVPVNRLKELLGPLRERGHLEKSFLGVFVRPLEPGEGVGYSGDGVIVSEVLSRGPAERAGLRAGDVISAMARQGEDFAAVDAQTLPAMLSTVPPQATIEFRVWRGGQERVVRLQTVRVPQ